MVSDDSKLIFSSSKQSGRTSITPPKLGSSRVKSPLPAPAAYRASCMSAAAKRYKYLRRIFHLRQMDFEFAIWQMLYLFYKPQNVYRNFQYRKVNLDCHFIPSHLKTCL